MPWLARIATHRARLQPQPNGISLGFSSMGLVTNHTKGSMALASVENTVARTSYELHREIIT